MPPSAAVLFVPLLMLSLHPTGAAAQASPAAERIIPLGGSVTETVFALGAGEFVVAVDESSIFPSQVTRLPQVGYYRALSTEGILSLRPTLVIASAESGPDRVREQVAGAGVRVVRVPEGYDPLVALEKIRVVAAALGRDAEGARLIEEVRARLSEAEALRARTTQRPKTLFVWSRGSGGLVVAGGNTGAGAILELAETENAAASIGGYQPMNAEAILAAAPEVIVVPQATVDDLGGLDALWALPGLGATPAGRARRVVTVDILAAVGFGPRIGDELVRLLHALHPELADPCR